MLADECFLSRWQNREHNHLEREKFMQTLAFLWFELQVARSDLIRVDTSAEMRTGQGATEAPTSISMQRSKHSKSSGHHSFEPSIERCKDARLAHGNGSQN
jgi:hypothetical protein